MSTRLFVNLAKVISLQSILVLACALAVPVMSYAEGYQVNTLSTRQNGMGHTGVALPLGAESMFFNPAGMAGMRSTVEATASFNAIMPSVKCDPYVNGVKSSASYENISQVATPLMGSLGMRVNPNVAVGLTFYTPYGSKIDWSDNWPGAELNQRVQLSVYTLQPTVAWKPIKNLSVGAGVMVSWGSVNLDKGLVSGTSFDAALQQMGLPAMFGNTVPASVHLEGKSQVTAGVNLGAMWEINPRWTVGASWRSQQMMKVKSGNASVNYANDIAQQILESNVGLIDKANFRAEMPAPWVFTVGASFRPTDRWTVATDVQLTGWKAYKSLDIEFLSDMLTAFDQHIKKNYHNSVTFKAGAQFAATQRLDVRCGLMVDTKPVNDEFYNPETPGATKICPSVGLSFRPVKQFSIDASVLYVQGLTTTGSCPYDDILAGPRTFKADYKVHAWVPSVGLTYMFQAD